MLLLLLLLLQAHSFELDADTTKFGAYTRGGIVTQHKESKVLNFKKLSDALEEPGEFLLSDFSKIERSPLLHLVFQALDAYQVRVLALNAHMCACVLTVNAHLRVGGGSWATVKATVKATVQSAACVDALGKGG